MEKSDVIRAAMGVRPFDLAVRNIQLVNVFTEEIYPSDIGIAGDTIAYTGPFKPEHRALESIDGRGMFAVPGFIDSHMHIESSMMTPAAFCNAVVPRGTTAVAADPHEIGNVLGTAGVRLLCEQSRDLPLRVFMLAPSTIPSAPGFETSAAEIEGRHIAEMLKFPGVLGLGEVMDFNGVIAGDNKMMDVISTAQEAGVLIDGHCPLLRGKELQAFASAGIDCDHTYMDPETAADKLRCGLWIQIQERFLTRDLMAFVEKSPVRNRICLVTDDVPVTRLASRGHLDSVARQAIALGLSPVKAVRSITINPADRLRMFNAGAIAPGRRADILLLSDIERLKVEKVFIAGTLAAEEGRMRNPAAPRAFPPDTRQTLKINPLSPGDFEIPCQETEALVNVIVQDGKTSRTKLLAKQRCAVEKGLLVQGSLAKMAVFERHTGREGRSLGLMANMETFHGAMATTYAHDCHNLVVFSSSDADAVLAANTVIAMGGGVSAVMEGKVLCAIALPIGGILCEDPLDALNRKFQSFLEAARIMGLNHEEPLTFLTLMSLAVSPEIKLSDKGLVDVMRQCFVPLIAEEMMGAEP
jgi:adenine deaminase